MWAAGAFFENITCGVCLKYVRHAYLISEQIYYSFDTIYGNGVPILVLRARVLRFSLSQRQGVNHFYHKGIAH